MSVYANALIVGGGPAGYSTAIALARNGVKDIHVIERSPWVDWHDPIKAYSYVLFPFAKDVLRDVLAVEDVDGTGMSYGSGHR
jgi:2-polyprenyl-6-methoxyphenol hydroxylase-like FAD-dependent oxidoreductase